MERLRLVGGFVTSYHDILDILLVAKIGVGVEISAILKISLGVGELHLRPSHVQFSTSYSIVAAREDGHRAHSDRTYHHTRNMLVATI